MLRLRWRFCSIFCIALRIDSGSQTLSNLAAKVCNDALELPEQSRHLILLWWLPLVAWSLVRPGLVQTRVTV